MQYKGKKKLVIKELLHAPSNRNEIVTTDVIVGPWRALLIFHSPTAVKQILEHKYDHLAARIISLAG